MRKLACFLVISFALILSASLAFGGQLTVAWDLNQDPTVMGYKVYYGEAPRFYSDSIDAGNIDHFTIDGLESGKTYYFAVVAYNSNREQSDFSNEVPYTIPLSSLIVDDGTGALGWVRTSGAGSMISGVDQITGSSVLVFSSTGPTALTAYRINISGADISENTIRWDLKMLNVTNTFFIVNVSTTFGNRSLYYQFVDTNALGTSTNVKFGIGTALKDGAWHTVTRNLQNDLQLAQPTNNLLSVTSFVVNAYGLGSSLAVDNIELFAAP